MNVRNNNPHIYVDETVATQIAINKLLRLIEKHQLKK